MGGGALLVLAPQSQMEVPAFVSCAGVFGMRESLYQEQLSYVSAQRRLFAGLIVILLCVLVVQSICLFFKHEKTILVPPDFKQSFWVEGEHFSSSYLEAMSLLFCRLILDVTEATVWPQGEMVLRYVWPASYGRFKQKLVEDEKRLKGQQLSLHFSPQTITQVSPLVMEVQGLLHTYVGAKRISQVRESYRLSFKHHQGQLFLEGFECVQTQRGKEDES
jgi:conjugal transfer pilus assembly protein TraE